MMKFLQKIKSYANCSLMENFLFFIPTKVKTPFLETHSTTFRFSVTLTFTKVLVLASAIAFCFVLDAPFGFSSTFDVFNCGLWSCFSSCFKEEQPHGSLFEWVNTIPAPRRNAGSLAELINNSAKEAKQNSWQKAFPEEFKELQRRGLTGSWTPRGSSWELPQSDPTSYVLKAQPQPQPQLQLPVKDVTTQAPVPGGVQNPELNLPSVPQTIPSNLLNLPSVPKHLPKKLPSQQESQSLAGSGACSGSSSPTTPPGLSNTKVGGSGGWLSELWENF
jgi:hypothetical protein